MIAAILAIHTKDRWKISEMNFPFYFPNSLILRQVVHLLDLKQKQANLWEARSARAQAEETANQGNTLLLFTIVTIVFVSSSSFEVDNSNEISFLSLF